MSKTSLPTVVDPAQRSLLEGLARGRNTPHKVVLRGRIVLSHAGGLSTVAISQKLQTSRPTVDLWLQRFRAGGVEALLRDAEIIAWTLHRTPKGRTHWSSRSLAKELGVGATTVLNVWRQHALKPPRTETFRLSRDPEFVAKVRDSVGLYLHPPGKALVFSVDGKSQIQASDRTQPGPPLKPGRCGTMTHDYKRRFHRHFTPTSSSWLNLVERFFSTLTTQASRRGRLPQRRGHHRLPGSPQRRPPSLRLAQGCRHHLGQGRPRQTRL